MGIYICYLASFSLQSKLVPSLGVQMTVEMWVKFLHVMIGTTLLGLSFASCFYASKAVKADTVFRQFSYKIVIGLECIVLAPLLLSGFVTGPLMVGFYGFSPGTPWIVSAYIYLSLAFLCRLGGIYWFRRACRDNDRQSLGWPYYVLQLLFWLFLLLIIHDAIAKPMHYLWQL